LFGFFSPGKSEKTEQTLNSAYLSSIEVIRPYFEMDRSQTFLNLFFGGVIVIQVLEYYGSFADHAGDGEFAA
jgi:hypothetical protein